MKQLIINTYEYDELSEVAKSAARNWFYGNNNFAPHMKDMNCLMSETFGGKASIDYHIGFGESDYVRMDISIVGKEKKVERNENELAREAQVLIAKYLAKGYTLKAEWGKNIYFPYHCHVSVWNVEGNFVFEDTLFYVDTVERVDLIPKHGERYQWALRAVNLMCHYAMQSSNEMYSFYNSDEYMLDVMALNGYRFTEDGKFIG